MDREKKRRATEEMGDAMKSLENRTLASKREMEILADLDEMKSMKSKQATVSLDAMLEALQCLNEEKERKLLEEEEALVRSIFQGPKESIVVKRINDEDIDDDKDPHFSLPGSLGASHSLSERRKASEELPSNPTDSLVSDNDADSSNGNSGGDSDNEKMIFKSPSVTVPILKKCSANFVHGKQPEQNKQEPESSTVTSSGLQSLCQQYRSDEDD